MFLQQLNLELTSSFTVNDIVLPILVNLKNIQETEITQEFLQVDLTDTSIVLDLTNNDYKELYKLNKDKLNHIQILKHIDIHTPLFEGKSLKDLWYIDTVEKLYMFLNKKGFNLFYLISLKQKVDLLIHELVIRYNSILSSLLELTNTDQLQYNSCMTELQVCYEHLKVPYFPENINKSFLDYSIREKYLMLSYFTKVNLIENAIENYKSKYMEKARKESEQRSKIGRSGVGRH